MIESTDAERTLLSAARRALSPTVADQARVRESIETALAAGVRDPLGADPEQASPWVPKLLLVAAIAAASGGVGYWAGRRAGRQEAHTVAIAVPAVRDPIATAPEGSPLAVPFAQPTVIPPERAPQTVRPARRGSVVTAPAAPELSQHESLAEEVRALRAVERALRDRQPGLALALLRELDRKVPQGRLHEERQATEAIARCATGDAPFGVNLAEEFSSRYPASVYGRRVADSCAPTDSKGPGDSSGRRSPQ